MRAQSPKHWTARGFPVFYLFYLILTTPRSCIPILMMKALKRGTVNLPKKWLGWDLNPDLLDVIQGSQGSGCRKDRWGRPKRSKKVLLSPHTLRTSRARAVLGLGMGGWEWRTVFVCSSRLGGEAGHEPGQSEGICYGQRLDFIIKPWVQIRVLPFPSCMTWEKVNLFPSLWISSSSTTKWRTKTLPTS